MKLWSDLNGDCLICPEWNTHMTLPESFKCNKVMRVSGCGGSIITPSVSNSMSKNYLILANMLSTILTSLFIIAFLLYLYDKLSRPRNYPPGPFQFPVVGVFPHFIFGKFQDKLAEWRGTYGDIFSFNFGITRVVLLNDLTLIKEAYNMDEFSGRPLLPPIRLLAGEERRGVTISEGPHWEAQRRFALRHLRDFGFGKKSIEAATLEDISDLIEKFRQDLGRPISTSLRFNLSVVSSLWHIVTGQRYDIDDPEFQNVLKKLNAGLASIGNSAPALTMDWLIKLAPDLIGWNKLKTFVAETKAFIQEQIDFHKETLQEGNSRDFMDVFLKEINSTTDENSAFYGKAGEENLLVSSLNLFAAGTETTSSTLSWALFYLSRNPSIQEKVQKEIDTVIGRSRIPCLEDKNSMPYVSATIMEVLRKSSLAPLSVPHCTRTDVEFHGYRIPKNTTVFANMYEVHNNRGVWGDPEVFRPERFLSTDGKSISNNHPPIAPFSIGRRQCLGETLARNNIFLFLVSLYQVFDIKASLSDGNDPSDLVKLTGLFRLPPHFQVIFEERAQTN